jgi:hypothetical protein
MWSDTLRQYYKPETAAEHAPAVVESIVRHRYNRACACGETCSRQRLAYHSGPRQALRAVKKYTLEPSK